MLRYWWKRLNDEIFGGELLPGQLVLASLEGQNALGLSEDLYNGRSKITICPVQTACSKGAFLATLAHEMVHQHQLQHGGDMDHGETFMRWFEPIQEATGLDIR